MKKALPICICTLAGLLILVSTALQAQQLKLGINPTAVKKSALLELESTTQGLLLTRISDTTTVTSPLKTAFDGTLIYLTTDSTLRIRAGGDWKKVNTGTSSAAITLGTQRLLGRYSAGTGPTQEISLDNSLGLTAAGVLYADSARSIWDASRIQNRSVLDTVPDDGDILKWNPTRSLWLPAPDITGGAAYGELLDNRIDSADAPDPKYRMKIWRGPTTGTVQNGPLGTTAYAWSVLSFQNGTFTTQLYFDKNTLALKEWGGNTKPLSTNAGNTWYKVVTTHGDNSFTDGGLIFADNTSDASSEVKQDAANLFWDNTNKELGIATDAPTAKLDVNGNFKLGTNGTVLTGMFKLLNVAVTNGTTFSNTSTNEITVDLTTPLAGKTISLGATVILNPRANMPERLGIGYVRRNSNTAIVIGLTNSGANTNLGTVNFDITIIQ